MQGTVTRQIVTVELKSDTQTLYAVQGAVQFKGLLTDEAGNPLPNMTVDSTALGINPGKRDIRSDNRSSTTTTDANGAFSVWLDSGYYDLVAEPPQGSGYSRIYFLNREVSAMRPLSYSRDLPEPVVLTGQVLRQGTGKPMPGAGIQAYGMVTDLRGFARPVLIGSAIADEHGTYVLLLPPSLGDEAALITP